MKSYKQQCFYRHVKYRRLKRNVYSYTCDLYEANLKFHFRIRNRFYVVILEVMVAVRIRNLLPHRIRDGLVLLLMASCGRTFTYVLYNTIHILYIHTHFIDFRTIFMMRNHDDFETARFVV